MITTVKDLGTQYLLNGSTFVPKKETNIHYRAIQDWINKGNTPDPPDLFNPSPSPDWTGFNTTLLADLAWQSWFPEGSDLRTAMVSAAIAADAGQLQDAYDVAKAMSPPPENGWQAIADENHIPVAF